MNLFLQTLMNAAAAFPSVINMLRARIQTQGTAVNATRVTLGLDSFAKKRVRQ